MLFGIWKLECFDQITEAGPKDLQKRNEPKSTFTLKRKHLSSHLSAVQDLKDKYFNTIFAFYDPNPKEPKQKGKHLNIFHLTLMSSLLVFFSIACLFFPMLPFYDYISRLWFTLYAEQVRHCNQNINVSHVEQKSAKEGTHAQWDLIHCFWIMEPVGAQGSKARFFTLILSFI